LLERVSPLLAVLGITPVLLVIGQIALDTLPERLFRFACLATNLLLRPLSNRINARLYLGTDVIDLPASVTKTHVSFRTEAGPTSLSVQPVPIDP
jgi:hypothetical protein